MRKNISDNVDLDYVENKSDSHHNSYKEIYINPYIV